MTATVTSRPETADDACRAGAGATRVRRASGRGAADRHQVRPGGGEWAPSAARGRQRSLLPGAMAIGVQKPERPRHLLGLRRRRSAGGSVSAQVQHADRRLGGIRLPHGEVLCPEPRRRRGRGAAGGKQFIAHRVSGQRRHRAEDLGERQSAGGYRAISADPAGLAGHPAGTWIRGSECGNEPGGLRRRRILRAAHSVVGARQRSLPGDRVGLARHQPQRHGARKHHHG